MLLPALIASIFVLLICWFIQPALLQGPSQSSESNREAVSVERMAPQAVSPEAPAAEAIAVAVYDVGADFRLWAHNAEDVRPIASLTKLMSGLVFIEHNPGWETEVIIERADRREGGKANLFPGDRLSVRDLFRTALVASDNSAVISLVRATGLTEEEFVAAMNAKAETLRLRSTVFADPTGLDPDNRSTAWEMTQLAEEALADENIREALTRSGYEFDTAQGTRKTITATNRLAGGSLPLGAKLIGGKTGHLPEAGYCFVGWFERDGREVITVVLGAPDESARFAETRKLIEWVYTTYVWNF